MDRVQVAEGEHREAATGGAPDLFRHPAAFPEAVAPPRRPSGGSEDHGHGCGGALVAAGRELQVVLQPAQDAAVAVPVQPAPAPAPGFLRPLAVRGGAQGRQGTGNEALLIHFGGPWVQQRLAQLGAVAVPFPGQGHGGAVDAQAIQAQQFWARFPEHSRGEVLRWAAARPGGCSPWAGLPR